MREGVREHHMHYGPKSYKLKLLGKLVVQHFTSINFRIQEFGQKGSQEWV